MALLSGAYAGWRVYEVLPRPFLALAVGTGTATVLGVLLRLRRGRQIFLLVASYAFYSGWNWRYLPLIVLSSTMDYWLALKIADEDDPTKRKRWLVITVVVNLSLLGFFKYWNFGLDSAETVARALGSQTSLKAWAQGLALPVGISFYTFESMSYVIDVYRRELTVCRSYLRYLLFVAFFPHLVAGPIVRPKDLLPQLDELPSLTETKGGEGLFLIALGLLKKVGIGDFIALNLVDRVFDRTTSFSALETLFGVYGYALQIYCDFSGYTDIAIGSALLFGIRINENFRSPYQSTGLSEFWRRWHISLSTWLRDYLYIPLGGNRGSKLATYRNLFLTMLLGGLWHGPSWTFVFWGFLHGTGLAVGKAWEDVFGKPKGPMPLWKKLVFGFVTFHFVCFCWIFFRAESFGKALLVIKQIGTLSTFHPNLPPKLLAVFAVGFATHLLSHDHLDKLRGGFIKLPSYAQAVLLFGVAVILHEVASTAALPFVYFQF